ncbi:MAG: rod shape-determining protein MreC [Patescibacteria group bacterium]|jgi:rod shape-determining protein MreC
MKKRGVRIWLVITVVVLALFVVPTLVSKSLSDFIVEKFSPISKALVSRGYKFGNSFSLLFEIKDLRSENGRLETELINEKVEKSRVLELEKENSAFKDQLDFKSSHPEFKLILSQVIGLDPTNLSNTILINRGAEDGVAQGMAVMSLGVFVGKVDQVEKSTSKVVLVTSKDSIVQVMLQDSRTTGVLRGGASGMALENIPLDTHVNPNENIITSGLGGRLPKGIFVGNAGSEMGAKSDIFKTILVKSPVNFSKLEYLFVVSGV